MRTCDEAWAALDSNFKTLMDGLHGLTEEELTTVPIAGIWTAKDVIAHVWSWVEEAVSTVRAWHGPRPWQQGVDYGDAWNEAEVAKRAGLSLVDVMDGMMGAHRRLMRQLDLANEEALAQEGLAPWGETMPLMDFFYSMAGHYLDHSGDLQKYQKDCLEGC